MLLKKIKPHNFKRFYKFSLSNFEIPTIFLTFARIFKRNFSDMIYHITTPESFEQDFNGEYLTHASLPIEGFIHCSTEAQVAGVLERYFVGVNEITILCLDENLLKSELKYEIATADEAFPHIFGTINKEAIVKKVDLGRKQDENFDLKLLK